MRGHARRRSVPSARLPMVNPPRTWSTAMGPPNSSSAYSGTLRGNHPSTTRVHDQKKKRLTSVTSRRNTLAVSTRRKLTTTPERQRVSANITLAGCTHTRAPRMSVTRHSRATASRSTAPLAPCVYLTAWRGNAMRATRGYSAARRRALSSSCSRACAFGAGGTSPADWSAERRSLRRTLMSRIVVAEM